MHKSVTVREVPGKGRGVVAIEDISRGTKVITDEAICLSVDDNWVGHCCEYCLSTEKKCIPCVDCGAAYFCSEECMNLALKTTHDAECYGLCRAIPTPVTGATRQALQGLLYTHETGESSFLSLHGDLSGLPEGTTYRLRTYGKLLRAMLTDEVLPHLTIDDLASCVIKVSKNSLSVPSRQGQRGVASGIFPRFAMLNHECLPSCETSFVGRRVTVTALKPIPPGMELSTRYTSGGGWLERNQQIKGYGFACACWLCADTKTDAARLYEGIVNGEYCQACQAVPSTEESKCVATASRQFLKRWHAPITSATSSAPDVVEVSSCLEFSDVVRTALRSARNGQGVVGGVCPLIRHQGFPAGCQACHPEGQTDVFVSETTELINEAYEFAELAAGPKATFESAKAYLEVFLKVLDSVVVSHSALAVLCIAACNVGSHANASVRKAVLAVAPSLRSPLIWSVKCLLLRFVADVGTYPLGGVSRLVVTVRQLVSLIDTNLPSSSSAASVAPSSCPLLHPEDEEGSVWVLAQRKAALEELLKRCESLQMEDHPMVAWAREKLAM